MKQALELVKKELGPEAFILSGKEVRPKKVMGLFSKNFYEVTAAVDYANPEEKRAGEGEKKTPPPLDPVELADSKDRIRLSFAAGKRIPPRKEERQPAAEPVAAKLVASPEPVAPVPKPAIVSSPPAPRPVVGGADPNLLLKELQELKNLLRTRPENEPSKTICWFKPRQFRNTAHEELYLDLIYKGLDESLADELVEDAFYEEVYPNLLSPEQAGGGANVPNLNAEAAIHPARNNVSRRIFDNLCRRIKITDDLISPRNFAQTQVVAMLGPTGVGKTTTLAKLAAKALLEDRMKVGLITLDTYRIAAVEQLRTYAEIIGVPTKVVENATQMDLAIKSYEDKDLILIDSPGRSQRNLEGQQELADYFRKNQFIKKVLLLSATTKQADLAEIMEKYKIFDPGYIILTKLDETQVYGSVISELVRTSSPLAFLTIGQNVPRDILKPDSRKIVDLALGNHPRKWEAFIGCAQ